MQKLHVCHVRKRQGLPLDWTPDADCTSKSEALHLLRCTTVGKSARSVPRDADATSPRFLPISTFGTTAEWLSGTLRITRGIRIGGVTPAAIPPTIGPATADAYGQACLEPIIAETRWTFDRDALVYRLHPAT